MSIDNQINRALIKRSEKHWNDVSADETSISTTWTWVQLNDIDQGDDYNLRQGDAVTMLVLRIKLFLQAVQSTTPTCSRVVVVHDNAANGAAPTGATVFSADSYFKFANHGYRQRYTILFDKLMSFGFNDITTNKYSGGNQDRVLKKSIKIPSKLQMVRYKGTGNGVADCVSGSIHLGFCADTASTTKISYSTRLVFTDN